MTCRILGAMAVGFSLLLGVSSMTAASSAVKDRIFETTLPNGLKIILFENHKAPVITFQVWYRVGSRNESWGKTGLSHVLEHMMFKGTKTVSGREFTRTIAENGGNENAFTSEDFTAYFENISSDRLKIPIDLEADRMHNLVLREQDFLTERMVVLEERRMRTEDNPQAYLMEQVQTAVFQTSPYHWPVIGWKEDLEGLTLEDLKSYYDVYYNPVNAFVVVVGDFQKEEILPLIEKAFGAMVKGVPPNQKKNIDPPQTGERRIQAVREAQLPYVLMAYHVPNLKNPDSYVLEVIAAILSSGKSSRLYRSLIEEKELALSANAQHSLLSKDPSMFMLSAQLQPKKTLQEAEEALSREIERLRSEPVDLQELEKAKNQLQADFVYHQESFFYQGMVLAEYEIADSWRKIDDYIPSITKVTPEDISRVANLYLVPDNRTVGTLTPLPSTGEKQEPIGTPEKQVIR